jgi:hypothetical protein
MRRAFGLYGRCTGIAQTFIDRSETPASASIALAASGSYGSSTMASL